MMCFFIAGIQPRRRTMDHTPRRCPHCGLHQAYEERIDHYISLFFIPLIPIKRGEPFLYCRRCLLPVDRGTFGVGEGSACTRCGRTVKAEFNYCPYCGQEAKRH